MTEFEELKTRLKELEPTYTPGGKTAEVIGDIVLANMIGPSGVGKSSINQKITQLNPEFSVPLGFTNRKPRRNEQLKAYRHIPNTAEGYQELLRKVEAREPIVQYTFHKTTDMIYGTEAQDYKTPYAVLDMVFNYAVRTHTIGFKEVKDIAIVTEAESYTKQLEKQKMIINDPEQMEKRRQEGILCVRWCLDRGEDIMWVHNRYGQLQQAAAEVISLVKGQLQPNPSNRQLGERLLKKLEQS